VYQELIKYLKSKNLTPRFERGLVIAVANTAEECDLILPLLQNTFYKEEQSTKEKG
jgi:hypothetical protein